MKNTKSRIASLTIALTIAALPGSAQAAVLAVGTEIGVDFGPTSPSNNFNEANAASGSISAGSIIDTSNVTVDGVGFTWSGGNNASTATFLNNDADETQSSLPSVFDSSNTTDWLGFSSADTADRSIADSITLTFTGLNDSFAYDLIIGAAFNGDVADVQWTVDGQSFTTDADVAGSSYVSFTGLSTDGSGKLVITGTGTGNRPDIPVVSALHLTAQVINDYETYISNPLFGLAPAQRGIELDPDGDKIPNGLEAWFGTHPGEFNHGLGGLATGLTTDGATTAQFTHPINADPPTDLEGYYQWSPDLTVWFPGGTGPPGGPTVGFVSSTEDGTATVTATTTGSLDRLFLRARVDQPSGPHPGFYSEFAHDGYYVKDYFVYRNPHDDLYHLYYNIGNADGSQHWRDPFNEKQFGHATSTDLKNWEIHDTILPVVPDSWESDVVSAPYIVEHEGLFYMAYTGFDEYVAQRMGIATSTDLFNWTRVPQNPVLEGPAWSGWTAGSWANFRDPGLLEWQGQWLVFNTVSSDRIALSTSPDLINWTHQPESKAIQSTLQRHESAMPFKHNGKVYLIASVPGNGGKMWMTDDPLSGSWQEVPFVFPGDDWSGWEYIVSPEGREILCAFFWKKNGNFIRFWEIAWDGDVPRLITE